MNRYADAALKTVIIVVLIAAIFYGMTKVPEHILNYLIFIFGALGIFFLCLKKRPEDDPTNTNL